MIDAASFWNIFIDKMPVKLSCTIPGCNHGDGVAMYKTPALEFDNALKMLDRHRAEAHGVKDERGGGAAVGRGESSILILIIIFQGKINVNIYIEPRNEVKIFKKWVWGMQFFSQKLTPPPLGQKKNSQI